MKNRNTILGISFVVVSIGLYWTPAKEIAPILVGFGIGLILAGDKND